MISTSVDGLSSAGEDENLPGKGLGSLAVSSSLWRRGMQLVSSSSLWRRRREMQLSVVVDVKCRRPCGDFW